MLSNQAMQRRLVQTIQPKLTVNQPRDSYEQEADRVADQVMRMPNLSGDAIRLSRFEPELSPIQRRCAACEEERQTPDEELAATIQTKSAQTKSAQTKSDSDVTEPSATVTPAVTPAIEAEILSSHSQGQPLPAATRSFFETRFGRDLGSVRVHTDARSAELNQTIQAYAFTHRNHIWLGAGLQPEPSHLLAHELTHVMQQELSTSGSLRQLSISQSNTPTRHEANRTASRVHKPSQINQQSARGILSLQRQVANAQCPGCTQAQCNILNRDFLRAITFVNQAIRAVSTRPLSNQTQTALRWYFKQKTPNNHTLEEIGSNLERIHARLDDRHQRRLFDCSPTDELQNDCTRNEAGAFVETPINANTIIHICPNRHFTGSDTRRAYNLIHEAAHLSGLAPNRELDIYGNDPEFRRLSSATLISLNADVYALFIRAIATGEIPSRLVLAFGGLLGAGTDFDFDQLFNWSATLYVEASLQTPRLHLINPSLRISLTLQGTSTATNKSKNPPVLEILGGIRLEDPTATKKAPYLSIFGGAALEVGSEQFIQGFSGFEVGVYAGYRWTQWDIGVGANYRFDPTEEGSSKHFFQLGPTLSLVLGGETH
jgi:hypothetical protein